MVTWKAVSFLCHSDMADTLVIRIGPEVCSICDVIKVLDAVLVHHISA